MSGDRKGLKYTNGDIYMGKVIANKDPNKHPTPNGLGKMKYANGNTYDGEWIYGKKHGLGIQDNADKSFYDGEWIDGKRHGQGTNRFVNGDIYEGKWINDEMSKENLPTSIREFVGNDALTRSQRNTSNSLSKLPIGHNQITSLFNNSKINGGKSRKQRKSKKNKRRKSRKNRA
jgi:hypothetical protein